jgi:hypothetical protein
MGDDSKKTYFFWQGIPSADAACRSIVAVFRKIARGE